MDCYSIQCMKYLMNWCVIFANKKNGLKFFVFFSWNVSNPFVYCCSCCQWWLLCRLILLINTSFLYAMFQLNGVCVPVLFVHQKMLPVAWMQIHDLSANTVYWCSKYQRHVIYAHSIQVFCFDPNMCTNG